MSGKYSFQGNESNIRYFSFLISKIGNRERNRGRGGQNREKREREFAKNSDDHKNKS
jgi:hypothetical protein